ncbi:hypothetical protein AABB24_012466 [Solanum stoloniferum]|uniref:Endonuclease/exonuclease/phosphatase domain-containing protein n=1 Tax=Solanum stoloniferum TaxID=62892 RepID=A0ABD2U462_9SOLN
MEPFQDLSDLERYRRRLGHDTALVNCSGQIWIFTKDVHVDVNEDSTQQMTLKVVHQNMGVEALVTVVYASCNAINREELWNSIQHISSHISLPWLVGGDFNVMLSPEEKLGGFPVYCQETEDFANCIATSSLYDLGYIGSTYTWWNGRSEDACIFKRLDRILGNQRLMNLFPTMKIKHLIKKGSDHSPLVLECSQNTEEIIKPFKFLNFWAKHSSFEKLVEEHWRLDPFYMVQQKLKRVNYALRSWSKETYGDVFQQIATLEDVIQAHEVRFEESPTLHNKEELHKAQAQLSRYLHLEEEYWRQKSGLKCFQEGEKNTKFFHSYVTGKRKKLKLNRIQNTQGDWLTEERDIAAEAIRYFQEQFTEDQSKKEFSLLNHIPSLVTEEQNQKLEELPTEEVKAAVFGLNKESACGPDGFTSIFYHTC